MSISGVSSNSLLSQSLQAWQAKAQKTQSEFQQLGQDLQVGNLSKAQADFTTLNQNFSTPNLLNQPVAQSFAALGTALQSGNLAAAQKAYATIQQDEQPGTGTAHLHHLGTAASATASTLSQAFQSYILGADGGALSVAQGLSSLA